MTPSKQISRYLIIFIVAPVLFLLSSCVIQEKGVLANLPPDTPTAEVILLKAPLDTGPTKTPFQPLPPTPTSDQPLFPTATASPTPTPFFPTSTVSGAPASSYKSPSVPQPMPLFKQPPNQINIILLGSDQRPYTGGYRTDVILLVTINFDLETVHLTSFPRDLYVYIPGYGMERINTAHFKGGFDLTAATFEYNFGIRPDHYGLINFGGFTRLIDTLGGINVQVAKQLTDQRTGYGYYTVYPGVVHMDGETALWYVRSRYSTNDFDRTRRQQEVLQAIFFRMLSFDLIKKVPQIYEDFKSTIQSDMTLDQMLKLVPLAPTFASGDRIKTFAIGPSQVTEWWTYAGAQVLLPNQTAVAAVMKAALNVP